MWREGVNKQVRRPRKLLYVVVNNQRDCAFPGIDGINHANTVPRNKQNVKALRFCYCFLFIPWRSFISPASCFIAEWKTFRSLWKTILLSRWFPKLNLIFRLIESFCAAPAPKVLLLHFLGGQSFVGFRVPIVVLSNINKICWQLSSNHLFGHQRRHQGMLISP